MEPFLNIIVNPVKAFNQLKTEEKFPVITLIILLTLVLINLILDVPINAKASELVLAGMPLPDNQIDRAIEMTHKLRYLTMIGGFFMYNMMLFLHALVLFVTALLFKTQITYMKAFRLIICCFIVLVIGGLVNTAIVYTKGIDNMESMYDAMMTGANVLTSLEKAGTVLYLLLASITPFQLWFVALLIIGFKIFTNSDWKKSSLICIIYWLIVTLFPVMTAAFSQMFLADKGLM